MHKRERQNALIALIETVSIASQAELALRLNDDGFSVTQASVSRDLDELGVIKQNGCYILPSKHAAACSRPAICTGIDRAGAIRSRPPSADTVS